MNFEGIDSSARSHKSHIDKVIYKTVASCVFTTSIAVLAVTSAQAQSLQLPENQRWLEVQQAAGTVHYLQGNQLRPAQIGDRLQQVGQGINTQARSTSVLELDTNIGVVRVAENTRLRVQTLTVVADGGRITGLAVDRGQARLQVRRFTHPSSEMEVETPAGVAAVRGTIFGVSVDPEGKTGIGTLVGLIEASAQGESVLVNPGFATIIIPGQPPTPPQPLDQVLRVRLQTIQRTSGGVIVNGQVDPANSVLIGSDEIKTQPDGRFRTRIPASPLERYVRLNVRNPLGDERIHQVVVP